MYSKMKFDFLFVCVCVYLSNISIFLIVAVPLESLSFPALYTLHVLSLTNPPVPHLLQVTVYDIQWNAHMSVCMYYTCKYYTGCIHV